MSVPGLDEFVDSVDWEATEQKNEDEFWRWAIEWGYGKHYIIDHQGELFFDWAMDRLNEKEFVYV